MKRLIITLCLISLGTTLVAQNQNRVIVGEKRDPKPDARLELVNPSGSQAGLLLPFVELEATNKPTLTAGGTTHAHLKGMTVYNTATAGTGETAVKPGIYYNDGTRWIMVGEVNSELLAKNFWSLTGNASTDPSKNFLGTTDDKDLVFKRSNIFAGRLTPSNTAFGTSALAAHNPADETAAEKTDQVSRNTALGASSMGKLQKGTDNVAVGTEAAGNVADDLLWASVAVGSLALADAKAPSNTGPLPPPEFGLDPVSGIVAVGYEALRGNNGDYNTAVGFRSMKTVTRAFDNTALGAMAMGSVSGNDNVAIGAKSLKSIDGDGNVAIGYETSIGTESNHKGSHNLLIGRGAKVPAGSYQLNIASSIFGKGVSNFSYATPGETVSRQAMIGIKKPNPTENFHVAGTTRIEDLPLNGTGTIYTKPDGLVSYDSSLDMNLQDQTFNATRTVVADANGVLGTVEGIPIGGGAPDVKPVLSKYKVVKFNSHLHTDAERNRVKAETTVTLGCITVYFVPALTGTNMYDGKLYIKLNSDNGDGGSGVFEPEIRFTGGLARYGQVVGVDHRTALGPLVPPHHMLTIDYNSEETAYVDFMLPFNSQVFRLSITGYANSALGDNEARIFIGLERKF